MKELWKDIKNYEGLYKISNIGRVRSVERYCSTSRGNGKRLVKGRILKYRQDAHNYATVNLNKDGIKKNFKIHRLVAEAFITKPLDFETIQLTHYHGYTVNHLDSNRMNNTTENLEWCTQQENVTHALSKNIK